MSHLVGWDIANLVSKDPKLQVNSRLNTVAEMIKLGFKRDFAGIMVTVTGKQIEYHGLDEFLPKCGFVQVFHGEKNKHNEQRHKDTGDIYLFTAQPSEYEKALTSFHEELKELKDKIDPPKKPDPKRQAFEDILLSKLRKARIVQDNTGVDNRIEHVLLVPPDAAAKHIKLKFGIDIKKWNNYGDNWIKISTRRLKEDAKAWKLELV
jgi:hypothetical protein